MANGLGLAFPDEEVSAGAGVGLGLSQPLQRAAEIKASVTQPRGLRNNNPLNIEAGSFTESLPGFSGSDGRFAKFDSLDSGLAAADRLLQSYAARGLDTVGDIINRWAPASENNTGAYAGYVSDKLGTTPDAKVDMKDPAVRSQLIAAMGEFENGQPISGGRSDVAAAAQETVDLSAARKRLTEGAPATPQRGNGVPQFDKDPIGAIGTIMQEVGNALQGKPGVIDKMKESAQQQRLIDLKMATGFVNIMQQAQKLSDLPPEKQKEGAAILNKVIRPVFGDIDVSAFIGNKSIDLKTLAPLLSGLSDESRVTLLNIAKAAGGGTDGALKVITNKDLIGNLQKADDSKNTPSIMQKGRLWAGALERAGVPLDKVTLPQLAAANEKLPDTVKFTQSELSTIERNPSIQRSLGLTTEKAAATAEVEGAKPTTGQKDYEFYAGQEKAAGRQPLSFNDWQLQNKRAGAQNIQIDQRTENAFAKEFGKKNAESFFERRSAATDAVQSLQSGQEARKLLDSGTITGFGANWKVGFGKALQAVNINFEGDAIANTEAFAASRAKEVGRIIKLFGAGTGLSDADREFATKAAAGDITLNEQSMRRILDINDRAARNIIQAYNADASKIDPKLSPFPLTVEVPPVPADSGAPRKQPPEVGTIKGGYRFKGGDPSKPENWESVR